VKKIRVIILYTKNENPKFDFVCSCLKTRMRRRWEWNSGGEYKSKNFKVD
jgi:hypothetical protein